MGIEVRWEESEDGWVQLGDRWMPKRFGLVHRGGVDPAWSVQFEVRDGVPQCRQVTVESTADGREVRSSDIRALKVEDLLEGAAMNVAVIRWEDEEGNQQLERTFQDWQSVRRDVRATRRRRITDEVLREVAEIYRANVDNRPTEAVGLQLGLGSDRTARLYVRRARDAGFLGESIKGKAGER